MSRSRPVRFFRGKPLTWVHLDSTLEAWLAVLLAQPETCAVMILSGGVFSVSHFFTIPRQLKFIPRLSEFTLVSTPVLHEWAINWVDSEGTVPYSYRILFRRSGRLKVQFYVYGDTGYRQQYLAWRPAPRRIAAA